MEVVHTVTTDHDLKVLLSALAYTDRPGNTAILTCRLHRRIEGLHYRNNDLEEADEHMETALQLAHNSQFTVRSMTMLPGKKPSP